MNYKDDILENKAFTFFKQLMYNIALAICIMLVGVLILVYGFNFKLYEVLSDSQAPTFVKGDMVVVKAQDDYKVGDIIKFDTTIPITHRVIAVINESGKVYYICHGDNVQNADGSYEGRGEWKDDKSYIEDLQEDGLNVAQISAKCGNTIQVVNKSQIDGKVLTHVDNYGTYVKFIKNHPMLLVALVAGIWCISSTIQNEIDMKQTRRLF